MKYGADTWKGIWPPYARRIQKRKSRKQERQYEQREIRESVVPNG